MVRAGLCQPGRCGRAFRFSFQELVLLRAANGLLKARVPPRRVRRAIGELTGQLPPGRPLSGVRIYADGGRVVVRDGHRAWQPESGQGVLVFDADDTVCKTYADVSALRRGPRKAGGPRRSGEEATEWFERGLMLEDGDPDAARASYQRALDLDPQMSDAHVNIGRLLHQSGDLEGALGHYHQALRIEGSDPVLHYDLALVLEDAGDAGAAVAHYHQALELNPGLADAHFNLGRLLERVGRRGEALRHLLAYRRLTSGR